MAAVSRGMGVAKVKNDIGGDVIADKSGAFSWAGVLFGVFDKGINVVGAKFAAKGCGTGVQFFDGFDGVAVGNKDGGDVCIQRRAGSSNCGGGDGIEGVF